jgi:hypothetical protein
MFCTNCGFRLTAGAKFCTQCGAAVPAAAPSDAWPTPTTRPAEDAATRPTAQPHDRPRASVIIGIAAYAIYALFALIATFVDAPVAFIFCLIYAVCAVGLYFKSRALATVGLVTFAANLSFAVFLAATGLDPSVGAGSIMLGTVVLAAIIVATIGTFASRRAVEAAAR